ncbi:MAG TPA: DUF1538 domain-containing protein [Rhodospirillales bacterium]|nr:DUF1538 domain-containing protein [Rhodospirillales bacterium]
MNFMAVAEKTVASTLLGVLPITAILFGFQFLIIRRRPANLRKIIIGFVYVVVGLTLFLVGLEEALFPLGETMAAQLTSPGFLGSGDGQTLGWRDYYWIYIFAAAIGFATTIAEPALIAVSLKAQEISGGAVSAWGLRIVVAAGVSIGVAVGAFRIVTGTPLPLYIMGGYLVVIILTLRASKWIIPLAYDSGGVTTSTVTVPVLAALGLGLASTIEGRSPLIDGFGLIAFASLFPIMSVLGYALLTSWMRRRKEEREREEST